MSKRKTSKKEEEKVQTTSTETTSGINYSGSVTVSVVRNGKVIKKTRQNSGTDKLFEILCQVLTGNIDSYISNASFPMKIQAYTAGTESPIFSDYALRTKAYAQKRQRPGSTSEIQDWNAIFEFTVPYTAIRKEKAKTIKLFNNSNEVLASVTAPEAFFEGDGQSNIIVEWAMSLYNHN